jgi:hypothetical protein
MGLAEPVIEVMDDLEMARIAEKARRTELAQHQATKD